MKINLNDSKDDAQVQIVPLIDVIFCILTFFLLAALQFSRQEAIRGINLDLATAKSGTTIPGTPVPGTPIQGQRLVLHVDGLGQIYDISSPTQTLIPKDQLPAYLQNYVKQNPTKPLVLNAARSASYNDVIETLDILRQVGGDRVSLGVIPGGADQSSPAPIPGAIPNQTIPNTVAPPNQQIPQLNPQINPQLNPQINPQGNFNPNLPTNQAPQTPVQGGTVPGIGAPNVNPPQSGSGTSNPAPKRSN